MNATEHARTAADLWRDMAEAAQDALAELDRAASALTGSNDGAAVEGFERAWRAVADPAHDAPLPHLVDQCRALARRCDEYAARLTAEHW